MAILLQCLARPRPALFSHQWPVLLQFRCFSFLQLKQHIDVDDPPRRLVTDLDFTVRNGERWAILGPNGSGKSTIAHTLLDRWEKANGSTAYVSFDLQRQVMQDERRDFLESRYESRHLRATVSSFLFPECYPEDPDYDPRTSGYRPPRTRVSPLPVPYDANSSHYLLQKLEAASNSGHAARLLHFFGLWQLRHRPLFALSTGEGRKLLMVDALLKEPSLLILDEAFDGLDKNSRIELASMLESFFDDSPRALVMIVHRLEDLVPLPTHTLLLGRGADNTGYSVGPWSEKKDEVRTFLQDSSSLDLPSSRLAQPAETGEPLVEFKDVTIEYGPVKVFDRFNWTVRESEKWIVVGGNGTGKTTLFDLISGENVLGYTQDLHLFGRQKGTGESIWDIKKQLGLISSELHMEYLIYADPRFDRKVTAWEVACSGLFDSIGLYADPTAMQIETVLEWVDRLGLQDLVVPPKGDTFSSPYGEGAMFSDLSHGQQKLVLLCRALVKCPRLLLLDEPTHGLSGQNRLLLLSALRKLAETNVAVVLITHREEEIEALGYPNVLRLTKEAHSEPSTEAE
ncbi:ABC transporter ATP-binding protein ModF (Photorepair protein PhrA) [Durusdinium trenchii]|uniref:ABC transporter ATP-binding protein ModF (Photorepair protein PhrA) n=1 Tax=Durusdinium trenchii TaxID=1381693 RepID=A0ABP0KQS0_9DINO